jgi:hypothetical protein
VAADGRARGGEGCPDSRAAGTGGRASGGGGDWRAAPRTGDGGAAHGVDGRARPGGAAARWRWRRGGCGGAAAARETSGDAARKKGSK